MRWPEAIQSTDRIAMRQISAVCSFRLLMDAMTCSRGCDRVGCPELAITSATGVMESRVNSHLHQPPRAYENVGLKHRTAYRCSKSRNRQSTLILIDVILAHRSAIALPQQ
jgi:hypothetical protein